MWLSVEKGTVYFGDKVDWMDIQLESPRPTPYHYPVIENGNHAGEWELNEAEQLAAILPESVSRSQGTMALYDAGLWSQVEAIYEAMPEGRDKFLTYQALYVVNTWERTSPALIGMAQALDPPLDEAALDDLFIAAGQITI
jgi:hypothetical protein